MIIEWLIIFYSLLMFFGWLFGALFLYWALLGWGFGAIETPIFLSILLLAVFSPYFWLKCRIALSKRVLLKNPKIIRLSYFIISISLFSSYQAMSSILSNKADPDFENFILLYSAFSFLTAIPILLSYYEEKETLQQKSYLLSSILSIISTIVGFGLIYGTINNVGTVSIKPSYGVIGVCLFISGVISLITVSIINITNHKKHLTAMAIIFCLVSISLYIFSYDEGIKKKLIQLHKKDMGPTTTMIKTTSGRPILVTPNIKKNIIPSHS